MQISHRLINIFSHVPRKVKEEFTADVMKTLTKIYSTMLTVSSTKKYSHICLYIGFVVVDDDACMLCAVLTTHVYYMHICADNKNKDRSCGILWYFNALKTLTKYLICSPLIIVTYRDQYEKRRVHVICTGCFYGQRLEHIAWIYLVSRPSILQLQ